MNFSEYEELYFALLDLTAGPAGDARLASLPKEARTMHVAAMLDMEVQNGGVCQFFTNCGSPYAIRAVESLRTVGLEPMAELYESFLREHQINPADLDAFQCDTLDDYSRIFQCYPFDAFDDAYMDLWEALDFNTAMLCFANAHPEAFQQP